LSLNFATINEQLTSSNNNKYKEQPL